MHESDTFQAILDEGEERGCLKGAKKVIMMQGRIRFGEPDDAVQAYLAAINDLGRLEALAARLIQVSCWQELLATP
jgi:hypothetical protein